MPTDRVRPLDITMVQAMSIVKAIGGGSSAALRGVDLTLPRADNQIEAPKHSKPAKSP
jgi:hypothetical protein